MVFVYESAVFVEASASERSPVFGYSRAYVVIPIAGTIMAAYSVARLAAAVRGEAPEDVAGAALALLVDRFSAYVTGTTVVVDGGLALHNWLPPPAG